MNRGKPKRSQAPTSDDRPFNVGSDAPPKPTARQKLAFALAVAAFCGWLVYLIQIAVGS